MAQRLPGSASDPTWCPPRMSDGRCFTQYLHACDPPIAETSNEKRARLMNNAVADMTKNARIAATGACAPGFARGCYDLNTSGTMIPELDYMQCDKRTCVVVPGTRGGIGRGRKM